MPPAPWAFLVWKGEGLLNSQLLREKFLLNLLPDGVPLLLDGSNFKPGPVDFECSNDLVVTFVAARIAISCRLQRRSALAIPSVGVSAPVE